MKSNVVLIGMPSSGKSTVGVILAKLLGYDFVDTDLLIQKKHGARLEELIRRYGTPGFLDLEAVVCQNLDVTGAVIATGGSVIYRDAAMNHLKAIGTVVYLEVTLDALQRRLHDMKARGVVLSEGQKLEDLYNERTALYQRYADLTVPEGNDRLEETVHRVRRILQES